MDLKYEKQKLKEGYSYVAGCDEVGRGSLAGPVVAGAVILRSDMLKSKWFRDVQDSKLLSSEKRELLSPIIKQNSLAWGIGIVSPKRIDTINIHNASLLAMKSAVNILLKKILYPDEKIMICVDGKFEVPGLPHAQEAIIDGDNKVLSIAAASIIAKVYRDSLMGKLNNKFPGYNLAQHKGYGTKNHVARIKELGLSPIHRLSFCDNII